MMRGVPKAVEVLAKTDEANESDHQERLDRARKDANLAQHEIDTGFPLVFSSAVVALWSLLEAVVRSTVVAWLKNEPKSFSSDPIAKLRIRVGDYEKLPQEERFHYIAELLEGESAAGLRNGVERFEALLKPFGLGGAVPERLRRDMFEFAQVRNAIVHRGGTTDRQLTIACPWLGLSIGEDLPIKRQNFDRYGDAAHWYVVLLICRVRIHFGADVDEHVQGVFSRYGAA